MPTELPVLIVEDSRTVIEYLTTILSYYGINTTIAEDGLAALQSVDNEQPSLIILDINLPKMDGYQVCRRLKRDPNTAHIPVIMLAGDQAACDELLELQPKAETVAVKRGIGKASAVSLSHEEAQKRIHEAARKAAARVREFTPWSVQGPVELKFEFKDRAKSPDRVYRGANVLEAFEAWLGK